MIYHQFALPQGNSNNIVPSVTFYFLKTSLSDNSRKCILPNMIGGGTLIIYGIMHFLLLSESEFFIVGNMTDGTIFVELVPQ